MGESLRNLGLNVRVLFAYGIDLSENEHLLRLLFFCAGLHDTCLSGYFTKNYVRIEFKVLIRRHSRRPRSDRMSSDGLNDSFVGRSYARFSGVRVWFISLTPRQASGVGDTPMTDLARQAFRARIEATGWVRISVSDTQEEG